MTTTPLNPDQLQRALALQALGRTCTQIAGELGCDARTVGRWLRGYNSKAWARLEQETAAEKRRQLEVLCTLGSEMVAAWFASTQAPAPAPATAKSAKAQAGSPAFSAEARACLADIRKLLRIDKADDPDDSGPAAALVTLASVFDTALAGLPPDVQERAREHVSKALLARSPHGHANG